MTCYVVYAYRDPFQLPLAVLDTVSEVAEYVNRDVTNVRRHLRGLTPHLDGYVVELVNI